MMDIQIRPKFSGLSRSTLSVVLAVSSACALPFVLNLLGIDFSAVTTVFDPSQVIDGNHGQLTGLLHDNLQGSFIHTILEVAAFMTALFTVILAFTHFRLQSDIVTPIIGVALFCAGAMDAFHILAADHLIEAVADNRNLIPFTWAISRLFASLILLLGAVLLLTPLRNWMKGARAFIPVMLASICFGLIAYLVIHLCAVSHTLPQTMFPNALITRPFDVVPLLIFAVSGIFVFPALYRKQQDNFSLMLVISCIPNVATQIYMAFGSIVLYDNYFNIAHFLKIIAYAVPFFGLCLDYVFVYRRKEHAQKLLIQKEQRISAVLDNAHDAIVSINAKGIIENFNPSAEKLFGYAAQEMIGKNVKVLMPEPNQSAHDGYIANYLHTGEKKIIGIGREVIGQRKDGSTFPLELAISEICLVNGQHFFTGIMRDISERKEAEKTKNEFISTVSHELRTPLTAIQGSLELMQGPLAKELPDSILEMTKIAHRNTKRLTRLINDILDLEKMAAGKITYKLEVISVRQLMKHSLEANNAFAQQHKVKLHVLQSIPDAFIMADKDRLIQVMTNLISNAVKFSPEHAKVNLSVRRQNDVLRFEVADQGPGIEQQFHSRIFQRFSQADSADNRSKGGSGLGLNIAKNIVEYLQGVIGFETQVGKGSTFYFELPEYHLFIPSKDIDSKVEARIKVVDIFRQAEHMQNELELLRQYMGKSKNLSLEITVSNVSPFQIYFQSMAMFEKAERLCFEHTQQHGVKPKHGQENVTLVDVSNLVLASLERIQQVKLQLGIKQSISNPSKYSKASATDIFTSILQTNRQLNLMLEQRFVPSDVFRQVDSALIYATRLLSLFGHTRSVPEPAYISGKNPHEVYQLLLENYQILTNIASTLNLKILKIKTEHKPNAEIEPSDVFDIASLIVSELAYIYQKSPCQVPFAVANYAGRKFPSHVFQKAMWLKQHLQLLNRLSSEHPERFLKQAPTQTSKQ